MSDYYSFIEKLNLKDGMDIGSFIEYYSKLYVNDGGEFRLVDINDYQDSDGCTDENKVNKLRNLLKFNDMSLKVFFHDKETLVENYSRISDYYCDDINTLGDIIDSIPFVILEEEEFDMEGECDEEDGFGFDVKNYYPDEKIKELEDCANKIAKNLNISNFKSNVKDIRFCEAPPKCYYEGIGYFLFYMVEYDSKMNFIDLLVLLAEFYSHDKEETNRLKSWFKVFLDGLIFVKCDDGIKILINDYRESFEIKNWDIEDYDPERICYSE